MVVIIWCCILAIVLPSEARYTVSHTITEDKLFYYRILSGYPAISATIEYSITYKANSKLKMDIYTNENHKNLKKQCTSVYYGQLRNENLHTFIRLGRYRFTTCDKYDNGSKIICHGNTSIQDYTPRYYGFSFGFNCGRDQQTESLMGLAFNVSIFNESNETSCFKIPKYTPYHDTPDLVKCATYYTHTSLPNMIGDPDWEFLSGWIQSFASFSAYANSIRKTMCHKHLQESLCHAIIPKCDPENNYVIHSCRETCYEFLEACLEYILFLKKTLEKLSDSLLFDMKYLRKKTHGGVFPLVDCEALPSRNGPVPCVDQNVTCTVPSDVNDMTIVTNVTEVNYTVLSQVEYTCKDETFHIEGPNTSTCLYSGEWSEGPMCVNQSLEQFQDFKGSPLQIVLPLLIILLIVYTSITITIKCKQRLTKISHKRRKTYDAFVCYCYDFDFDYDFAENTIRIELEENHDPPFRLCIHRRDFLAAWDIMWNIDNAIKNSNSAIIVMSQDYVNSLWCREEFEQCYLENMKDPAFKLFVIIMQPTETLENISIYMDRFFTHKTYLERNDPRLFRKIAKYLTWVKKPSPLEELQIVENELPGDEPDVRPPEMNIKHEIGSFKSERRSDIDILSTSAESEVMLNDVVVGMCENKETDDVADELSEDLYTLN